LELELGRLGGLGRLGRAGTRRTSVFETSELPRRKGVFETSVSELTPTLDEFGDRASMSRGFALELLEAGGWRLEVRGCSVDLLLRRGFCCQPC
jgi:hypothetical protein